MSKLKNRLGFVHIITSAYNPRTNEKTERFNQTLKESLRNHAEADRKNWPRYLSFVLMAYTSRVHTSTGYTPFELMFGRKILHFKDYTSEDNDTEGIWLGPMK
ncbi:unnamed protein product [Brachionus calyciflorus]|uniref:Integrase catalytic domain-containing protein n=1 Tax=Brachionus calyciflorus TaxID=104777 RepID=A0A813SZU6_9BILA|nr:unnamed protein product [Brachionus calyciflorus]